MNEAITTLMIYVGIYSLVLLFLYLLLNFLTNGFLTIYLKVKFLGRSKNRLLIMVRGRIQTYFIVGTVEGGDLLYQDNEARTHGKKTVKRVKLSKNAIFRMLNVHCVFVDEATNCVLQIDLKGVSGFDAVRMNDLIKRALHSAKVGLDANLLKWVFVVSILALVGVIIVYFRLGTIDQALAVTNTITGGNVQ
jgi:hypothetical protein